MPNPYLPRRLSTDFLQCLQTGFLSPLKTAVKEDIDLNLEIRANYLNIYYKGNSLLKLSEVGPARYAVDVHTKFAADLDLPAVLVDDAATQAFMSRIPDLKRKIGQHGQRSLEVEYEQLIIRANNAETRNNSEYFIIDRQYTRRTGRFDLLGLFWAAAGRRRNQTVPLCLFEVKFALNQEIALLHEQLQRYYEAIADDAERLAGEMQELLLQKLSLGVLHLSPERAEAMRTLKISPDINQYQFVVLLVDYNPNSKLRNLASLRALPFAKQIRLMSSGFAMWKDNVKPLLGE